MKVSGILNKRTALIIGILAVIFLIPALSFSQALPKVTIGIDQAQKPGDVAVTLQIILLLTILSLAPAILIMVTSFTRVMIVFSFLRNALGTQQTPPTQVLVGLAVFLTVFIMAPVWQQVNSTALQPYLDQRISQSQAFQNAMSPVRDFMFRQTREKDLGLFLKMANLPKPENISQVPTYVLIPAFIISEFRIAFQIGFLLYIPFLMLDMIVASVLMSMGMMMLPPVMISLPFKLLLFVLVDGWYLIVESIITGFK
ncbi:MAG TPA: flagellar type III secretion system pore protein FliP [bacterium]|nr:flagellar type III secretion system pore protein FliP [bacterium]HPN43183.1 flagellar type III secretion system pore protein FliP [bacterium]